MLLLKIQNEYGVCKKFIYKSKKDALTMLNFRKKVATRGNRPTAIYFCTTCHGYHLTSSQKYVYRNRMYQRRTQRNY